MILKNFIIDTASIDNSRLLEHWQWLIDEPHQVLLITLAGDAFLINESDGSVAFLDTVDGIYETVANGYEELKELLADEEFTQDYFSIDLIGPLADVVLEPEQVYSFKKPPVLGGEYHHENLEPINVYQHFDECGILWDKLQALNEEIDTSDNQE